MDVDIRLAETSAPVLEWMAATDAWLGVDVETTGLDVWGGDTVRTLQVSDGAVSWVVPAAVAGPVVEALRGRRIVAHNAMFDLFFLARGFDAPWLLSETTTGDTIMLIRYIDNRYAISASDQEMRPMRLPNGLKEVSTRFIDGELAEAEKALFARFRELKLIPRITAKDKGPGFRDIPIDDPAFVRYAGLDPAYCVALWNMLLPQVTSVNAFNVDMELQQALHRMAWRGLYVFQDSADELKAAFEAQAGDAQAVLTRNDVESPSSHSQIKAAFARLGVEPGKGGSWDKNRLTEVVAKGGEAGELAESISVLRGRSKQLTTYINPIVGTPDGYVHPGFMQAYGTVTGRMAMGDPPIQQFPKRQESLARACLGAPEGWTLIDCDLDSIEPRVIAAVCQDKQFLADLMDTGKDIYLDSSEFLWGTRTDRGLGKMKTLAWVYGASANTLAKDGSVTVERAAQFRAWMAAKYPEVARTSRQLNQLDEVYSLSGRKVTLFDKFYIKDGVLLRRTWDDGREKDSRKGLNAMVQSSAREFLARAVLLLIQWGWDWAIWHLIHDEAILCVPEDRADEAMVVLEKAMNTTWMGVPVTATAENIGRRWGKQ